MPNETRTDLNFVVADERDGKSIAIVIVDRITGLAWIKTGATDDQIRHCLIKCSEWLAQTTEVKQG